MCACVRACVRAREREIMRRSDTEGGSEYINSFSKSRCIFYRVEFGCSTEVTIPAEDPDSDIVRCRWAEPNECGQACTNTPDNALKLSKVHL